MAEIILEPTALSKVIPLSLKLNEIDSSLVSQLVTNKQFNTADTDAWFSFTLDGLAATTGTFDLTLINLQDKSVFNHEVIAFNTNPFYYKLDSGSDELTNEIRHAGKWVGQLVVTLANGDSATRKFIFSIEGHILDGTVVRTILLEDYNALIADIEASKDELTQYNIDYASLIDTVTTQEAARVQAELTRTETFNALVDSEIIAQNVATELQNVEATYAPRLLSAEQQLAQAATKTALAVEKARIDSLATLAAASTTGDAELIDGRIGADGTTYANLGSAVRGQMIKVNDDLSALANGETTLTGLTLRPGFVSSVTGIYNSWDDSGKYKCTDYLSMPDALYEVVHNFTLTSQTGVAFFDETKTFLTGWKSTTTVFEIPENTKYIILSNYKVDAIHTGLYVSYKVGVVYQKAVALEQSVATMAVSVEPFKIEEYTPSNLTAGAYLGNTANIGSVITIWNTADYKYLKLPVSEGDSFLVTSTGINNGRAAVFLSDANVNVAVSAATLVDEQITVPAGVAFVVFNNTLATSGSFFVKKLNSIDKLNGRVAVLESASKKYSGESIIAIGDSHSANSYRSMWLPSLCEKTGLTNDATVNNAVSIEGDYTDYGHYVSSFIQACAKLPSLISDVDFILLENVHFIFSSGAITDKALVIDKVINHATVYESESAALSAWSTSGTTILTSHDAEKQLQSALSLTYNKMAKRLTFSAPSTLSAGTVTITVDGIPLSTPITAGMTVAAAVQLINAWRFEDYTSWINSYSANTMDLTYENSGVAPEPTITFDAGTTGLVLDGITDVSKQLKMYKYFTSYNIAEWSDTTKWTTISMWTPAYAIVKGCIELLQKAFPNARIIMWSPGAYYIQSEDYGANFDIDSYFANDESYIRNRTSQEHMQASANYYHVEYVDVDKRCGITPLNFTDFYNFNDVHLKATGYERYAEVLAKHI